MIGVVFGGIAVGPAIGSLTIQATGNALAPFYVALVVHFLQTLVTIFIMPESLSKDKQADARQAYNDNKVKKQELAREDAWIAQREGYGRPRRVWIAIKAIFRPVLSIFAPLALLGPTPKTGGGWDWSLPVLAVTTGFYTMMMVSPNQRLIHNINNIKKRSVDGVCPPSIYSLASIVIVNLFRKDAIRPAQIRLVKYTTWQFPHTHGSDSHSRTMCCHTSSHQIDPQAT